MTTPDYVPVLPHTVGRHLTAPRQLDALRIIAKDNARKEYPTAYSVVTRQASTPSHGYKAIRALIAAGLVHKSRGYLSITTDGRTELQYWMSRVLGA